MKKETKKKIGLLIVGAIIFVIFIFPLYWMLVTALKTQVEIFQIPTPLWPKDLTFEAFQKQLSASSDTLRGFRNSFIIGLGAMAISTILAIPASYGLARFKFKGKKVIILLFLITQMLPSTLVLTSLYIMFSGAKLLNTYWAPILADATLGIPFSVIILRTYFLSIPKELDEAAKIDGCGHLTAFVKIMLPIAKPGVVGSDLWNHIYHKPQYAAHHIQYLQLCAAVPDTLEFHHGVRHHCHPAGGADLYIYAKVHCKRSHKRRSEGIEEGQDETQIC